LEKKKKKKLTPFFKKGIGPLKTFPPNQKKKKKKIFREIQFLYIL